MVIAMKIPIDLSYVGQVENPNNILSDFNDITSRPYYQKIMFLMNFDFKMYS